MRRTGINQSTPQKLPLGIYIHFPYCRSRCPYCDFFKHLKPKEFDEETWATQIIEDSKRFVDICQDKTVQSVYFGGGTPSILSPQTIEKILNELAQSYHISSNAEITLEANPNTYEANRFLNFKKSGINRLSLGVQALNKADLKFLGRTHSLDDALKAVETGMNTFEKFTVDLIYARPNQIWENWQNEIDLALSFGLKHISLYELSIEEGTPFYKKGIKPMAEEPAALMYENTVSYLQSKGLERYEVSNFASDSKNQSHNNLIYWQGGDYLGLGEGAHGRLHIKDTIFATIDGNFAEKITPEERAEELTIMGLRLKEGIKEERFKNDCGLNFSQFFNILSIKTLAELNLLCYSGDEIRLTEQGFLVLDKVITELLTKRL